MRPTTKANLMKLLHHLGDVRFECGADFEQGEYKAYRVGVDATVKANESVLAFVVKHFNERKQISRRA